MSTDQKHPIDQFLGDLKALQERAAKLHLPFASYCLDMAFQDLVAPKTIEQIEKERRL